MIQYTSGLRLNKKGELVFDENNPKVKMLDRLVAEKLEKREKIVIFSRFPKVARALWKRYLDKYEFRYNAKSEKFGISYMDGSRASIKRDPFGKMVKCLREEAIEVFQKEKSQRLFITTYGTGSEAITLTAANNAVLYDLDWEWPEQPINRVWRLGQEFEVNIFSIITQGTIDQRLVSLHQQKEGSFRSVIEGFLPSKEFQEEIVDILTQNGNPYPLATIPAHAFQDDSNQELQPEFIPLSPSGTIPITPARLIEIAM